MDPHKRPATSEVIDERAVVLAAGWYGTDTAGYGQMLAVARRFAGRVWAVEGCNGIGRHLARRLVHDGEVVVDVPPKLSARVRVFAAGNGRKTDPAGAHSVALVALRTPGLVQVRVEEDLVVLGMLADRRDELGRARTQLVSRLHRLLLELLPGGAKKFLSARQARTLIAAVRPRDLAGQVPPAAGRAADRRARVDRQEDQGPGQGAHRAGHRARIHPDGPARHRPLGCGPAARRRRRHPPVRQPRPVRLLERHRAAGASSGSQARHRLSRARNRRINRVLHVMAIVQLRNQAKGRACYDARRAGGMPSMMAIRALKRRLSNVVSGCMLADQKRREASPGGNRGRLLTPA